MWLVKNVLEWTFSSQQGEPICHVARSAKIFNKQFDTWIYFKCVFLSVCCVYTTPTTSSAYFVNEVWNLVPFQFLFHLSDTWILIQSKASKYRENERGAETETHWERKRERKNRYVGKENDKHFKCGRLLICYLFSEGRWQTRNMANRSFTNLNNSFFNQAPFSFISWTYTVVFVNKFNEEIFFRD